MRAMAETLVRLGWRIEHSPLAVTELAGSSATKTYRFEGVVKIGPRDVVVSEFDAYQRLRDQLAERHREIFPAVAFFGQPNGSEAALVIEPVPGETLEDVLLKLGPLRAEGKSAALDHLRDMIARMIDRTLDKLGLLVEVTETHAPDLLRSFVAELESALSENLARAGLQATLPSFHSEERFLAGSWVAAAHRDLSVVNIIGDGHDVRFIDPRLVVPHGRHGASLASPAFDLVALQVSLERKGFETGEHALPGLDMVQARIRKQLQEGRIGEDFLTLAEATVRAMYAACRCTYCLAAERRDLYDHMVRTTIEKVRDL